MLFTETTSPEALEAALLLLPPGTYKIGDGVEVNITDAGSRFWYQDGQLHRASEPAMEIAGGSRSWWLNGMQHREDGPAVEWVNGYREWWIHGERAEPEA